MDASAVFLSEGIEATNLSLFNIFQSVYLENAIKKAYKAQVKAADIAASLVKQYGEQAMQYMMPYLKYGQGAVDTLERLENAGYFTWSKPREQYPEWKEPEFKFKPDEGYAFRALEGQRAIESSAAARGMGLSGSTQRALTQYSQNLAAQEYNNAWNRYMQQRQQQFAEYANIRNFLFSKYNSDFSRWLAERQNTAARLSQRAGTGFAAAANLSNITQDTGSTLSSLELRKGQLKAGKDIALGNLASQVMYNQGQINDAFIGGVTGQDVLSGLLGSSETTTPLQVNNSAVSMQQPTNTSGQGQGAQSQEDILLSIADYLNKLLQNNK